MPAHVIIHADERTVTSSGPLALGRKYSRYMSKVKSCSTDAIRSWVRQTSSLAAAAVQQDRDALWPDSDNYATGTVLCTDHQLQLTEDTASISPLPELVTCTSDLARYPHKCLKLHDPRGRSDCYACMHAGPICSTYKEHSRSR